MQTPETRPPGRIVALEAALAAIAIALVYATVAAAAARAPGYLYDDGVYLVLGKALADGEGYRSLHLVGTPLHVKFPPVMPALHAVLWTLGGSLDRTMRLAVLINIAAAAGAAALAWWLARRSAGLARWSAALFVVGPFLLPATRHYFVGATSEPWFLLAWLGALALAGAIATARTPAARWPAAVTLGIVLGAAALTRSQGIALVLAVPLALLLRRGARGPALLALLIALLPVAGWGWWTVTAIAREGLPAAPDQRPYLLWMQPEQPRELLRIVPRVLLATVPGYARVAAGLVPPLGFQGGALAVLAVAGLAVLGAGRLPRRAPGFGAAVVATSVATALVLVLWPYTQDRFLTTLLPVAGFAIAVGGEWVRARMAERFEAGGRRDAALAGGYATLIGVFALVHANGDDPDAPLGERARRAAFTALTEQRTTWIMERTSTGDHILTDQGAVVWLRTGRRTIVASPEEPLVAARPEDTRRYHAEQIVSGDATWAIDWTGGPQTLGTSLQTLRRRCPRAVKPLGTSLRVPRFGQLRYWALAPDDCLWREGAGG